MPAREPRPSIPHVLWFIILWTVPVLFSIALWLLGYALSLAAPRASRLLTSASTAIALAAHRRSLKLPKVYP